MKEENVVKISLTTLLLLLAIIAIIVMGYFMYKLNNDKKAEAQKSTELQSQVDNLSNTVDELQGKINKVPENVPSNDSTKDSTEYQISGTYYQENAQGDEPNYTFSGNNKVVYGSLWTCSGTYTIIDNTIKITFTSAADPDGNAASVKGYGVEESVELTILNENSLKDASNGLIYSKKSTDSTIISEEVEDTNLTTYNGNEYTFKYNKNWKDLGIATKDSVGSVNRRVGALQLETENKDRVSILKHSNTTLNNYIEEHKNSYLDPAKEHSEDGGFELISEDSYSGNSLKGYKIVFKQMDLIYVSYLLESNNTVYEIEYPGSESNYNSIKSDLEKTVNSFKTK